MKYKMQVEMQIAVTLVLLHENIRTKHKKVHPAT